VKCSWNGGDPNWGRVLHAVGYSGAKIQEEMVDIYFNGLCAAHHGLAADTPLEELLKAMEPRKIKVCINLNLGPGEYNIYTSDLSPEYVIFNRAEYSLPAAKKAAEG
jgi:glutamate N-acetyltransferase/amino-acid N-acetyltransferase